MRSITFVTLLVFLAQEFSMSLSVNLTADAHNSMDVVSRNLVNRALKALSLHHTDLEDRTDLEDTALGKLGNPGLCSGAKHNVGIPSIPRGFATREQAAGANVYLRSIALGNRFCNQATTSLGSRRVHLGGRRSVMVMQGSGQALPATTNVAGSVYDQLSGVQLTRASDAKPVELTSLWRKDLALGIGGERVVVFFLRHFG